MLGSLLFDSALQATKNNYILLLKFQGVPKFIPSCSPSICNQLRNIWKPTFSKSHNFFPLLFSKTDIFNILLSNVLEYFSMHYLIIIKKSFAQKSVKTREGRITAIIFQEIFQRAITLSHASSSVILKTTACFMLSWGPTFAQFYISPHILLVPASYQTSPLQDTHILWTECAHHEQNIHNNVVIKGTIIFINSLSMFFQDRSRVWTTASRQHKVDNQPLHQLQLRICGPKLWNTIDPAIINSTRNWHSFKKQFKKYLLTEYI